MGILKSPYVGGDRGEEVNSRREKTKPGIALLADLGLLVEGVGVGDPSRLQGIGVGAGGLHILPMLLLCDFPLRIWCQVMQVDGQMNSDRPGALSLS